MLLKLVILDFMIIASSCYHNNLYPGSVSRPVLSNSEAQNYIELEYLQGWLPESIHLSEPDYSVGYGEPYSSIQTAINVALSVNISRRQYIYIKNGIYQETVYIPASSIPLTIYGCLDDAEAVQIRFNQSAVTTGIEYASTVNPNGTKYKTGDPAYSMYEECALKSTLGTRCSGVFWIMGDNVQISHLTVENTSKNGQAVAVQTNGDKVQFDHVNIKGFQDSFYLNGNGRVFINKSLITGDVDFVFGSATAIFLNTTFIARDDRPRNTAIIFAPSTPPTKKYGFLVKECTISTSGNISESTGLHLARAWDGSDYIPGTSANGQLIIRESIISKGLNVSGPYSPATSGRPFMGNIQKNRDLDDVNYNRFWEYDNVDLE
uniref:Pectinesterase n=1 Tax=Sitophilus oryzae TaxID=7048 RepID=E7CIP9_SITOR|nr:pectin methylesterase [Sitophilus oryzae]